jgi:alpha-1,6-mannosyltransferase
MTMATKTLHLTNSWHESSGGIATFYRALIEEANRRRHQMRLVVPGERDLTEDINDVCRIYHLAAPRALLNSHYRTVYPSQFLAAGSKLQRILQAERPDLVEICDKYTLNYLGPLLRKRLLPGLNFRPIVVGLTCERMDDNFRSYIGKLPFWKNFCSAYMRWLYFPFFDHHIANSEYTATELRAAGRGQVLTRGVWIRHMGVNLSHLSPARRSPDKRARLLQPFGAFEDSGLLLYVGRLVPEKNLTLLFGLLTHLVRNARRDFRLLVVGDGMERRHWQNHCERLTQNRAWFLGHIKDPEVLADIYANCDIFVHPNPHEPFGIAPLEAMASGLPLVAPNSGGVTSYANVANAWVVEPAIRSFAAAVEEIISQEGLRTKKIEEALRTAQEYRWETVAASFLDLYRELHQMAEGGMPPAFYSTPATGLRRVVFHGISQTAEKVFSVVSGLSSMSQAGS